MSPYRRAMPATWWLRNRAYFLFMVREFTSVFVAAYLVLFLIMVHKLGQGRDVYDAYVQFLATPGMLGFHVVALGFALFHAITWFNILPKVVVVRLGGERVPAGIVAGVNYAAWMIVSVLLGWFVLRG